MVVGATKDIAQPLAQSNGRCRGAQPWPFDTWQMRVDDGNHACGASNVPPLRVSALGHLRSHLAAVSGAGSVCTLKIAILGILIGVCLDEGF